MHAEVISKVLIHEGDPQASARIKSFCEAHNLVGVKGQHQNVIEALRANIDLGGVFLTASANGVDLGRQIQALRPELPIFLRLPDDAQPALVADAHGLSVAIYRTETINQLKDAIDRRIFNRHFPAALVRGISEITLEILRSQFRQADVRVHAPYLINDRLIHGQLFSLMPLETSWCRGYMMLQAEEEAIEEAIRRERTPLPPNPSGFREAIAVLGEVSNLVWGAIRGRFDGDASELTVQRTQVPILINHQEKYISFGAGDPQLCFHYTLRDACGDSQPIELYQKFIFNLNWAPEHFPQARPVDDYVLAGELELF